MNLLPSILASVITVTAGIVVYDQLRSEDPAPPPVENTGVVDNSLIEDRLAALEAERRPLLRAEGSDPRILKRLDELERRVNTLMEARAEAPPRDETPKPDANDPVASPGAGENPSPEAVERFRRLQAAARRQDRVKRNSVWIEKTLARLDVNLSKKQRQQLVEAFTTFQNRRNEIWDQVKQQAAKTIAAGGEINRGELVADTTALIQQEFTEKISDFIPEADADAISAALNSRGK